jgi:hypothetical protein
VITILHPQSLKLRVASNQHSMLKRSIQLSARRFNNETLDNPAAMPAIGNVCRCNGNAWHHLRMLLIDNAFVIGQFCG